jgi:2-polyprenyl-3-methyl-5-hydroxy-6-metoxy-1,4-benzoquinol methylase
MMLREMPDRTRARELAAEYIAKGDPTGWFEQLYREAEAGTSVVPWAELQPSPNLLGFWKNQPTPSAGKKSLVIGCGLGDDAEQFADWGFSTTAFDVSESAVRACRRRFPDSPVEYVAADLLQPPEAWFRAFDFVFECNTLQVLPAELRSAAMNRAANFVREGGNLLVIARARDENDPQGQMPWPLTRRELKHFSEIGLRELSFEDFLDSEDPPVRRFRALYVNGVE